LRCGSIPLLRGRMGRMGNSVAVRVEGAVKRSDVSKL
jgi:flagellar motor switch protein FliM